MIVWLRGVGTRRKLTESSDVVTPIPAGALVSTELLSAISATKAIVPARKTPAPDCHHKVAGIHALATPRPTSDSRRPVNFVTGAAGSRCSRLARSRSSPGVRSTSAPHVPPCGASLTMSGTTIATCLIVSQLLRSPPTNQVSSEGIVLCADFRSVPNTLVVYTVPRFLRHAETRSAVHAEWMCCLQYQRLLPATRR
jgi:hypothetical protein